LISPAAPVYRLPLFAGYGIELEYMIVDRDQLDILAVSDEILKSIGGEYVNEVELDSIAWSNEIVLHVIELKTNGPAPSLPELPALFLENVRHINSILAGQNARLMPTSMHPWMDPDTETRLWPHSSSEIYNTYNRIFDCRGHGWSNLQSMHVNLPFADDIEFGKLHTAIRLLLPVMPAIAASSPVMNNELTALMDTRLETYRGNAAIIPSITGMVIPEPVISREEYERMILQPMYDDIAPYDPQSVLQEEWLNSRGAIARFDRNTIEIRVLDTQETPLADLAVASLIAGALKKLTGREWSGLKRQLAPATESLAEILDGTIRDAEQAVIGNREYLKLFGFPDKRCEAREFWHYLYEAGDFRDIGPDLDRVIRRQLELGPLARRISNVLKRNMKRHRLAEVYRTLCICLETGELFEGI